MIPYGRQSITEEDIAAVVEVLRSDWITQGPVIPRFERAVADYCGAQHALAVSHGTAALHLACLALGLGPGDSLWTSPITFVASANCARYCGAAVDFVDIDPQTYNISVSALRDKLEAAKSAGRLPKIVVPVHFAGQPCDMAEIAGLAREFGFFVLGDACHALGAEYQGGRVGNCEYADISVFSFHPVKSITTGEGGMLLTNDPVLHRRAALLRSHGISREGIPAEQGWYYEQHELGFNYRLTDLQAALGLSQLSRLEEFIARRRELAARYDAQLAGLPLQLPYQASGRTSARHLYPVQLKNAGTTRNWVYQALRGEGIGVNVHYIPVHTQPYYRQLGFHEGQFPVAEAYARQALSLPLYPGMTDEQQEQVVGCLQRLLS